MRFANFYALTLSFSLVLCSTYCAGPVKIRQPAAKLHLQTDTLKKVRLGSENLILNHLNIVRSKRIGLLTNSAGVTSELQSSIELFYNNKEINLVALFSPEHGIRGTAYAGDTINDEIDPMTGLKIYSLYSKRRIPDAKMLENIDIIIIDLQDTGIRSYTYIYSMAEMMKAAARYEKEIIILDRPNPLGGLQIEGNILDTAFASFVGMYPIPYRYAMTIGELARFFNEEFNIGCKLTVIPMLNWIREMYWKDTGLQWTPTSPHIPHSFSPMFNCISGPLGELQTVSNGVGYTLPFELIGAPWIDAYKFSEALNNLELPGIYFQPVFFKPYYATFSGQICRGVQIYLTDPDKINLYVSGLHIIQTLIKLYPEQDIFRDASRVQMFNKVLGCNWILNDLENNIPVEQIQKKWLGELKHFMQIRTKYLLYPENGKTGL